MYTSSIFFLILWNFVIFKNNGNKLQISKCLFRVLLSLAQMQNLEPIYKTKNVYSLMFMLVIIHRTYVLKLYKICTHHQYFLLNKK
jgi:hypothetical protein